MKKRITLPLPYNVRGFLEWEKSGHDRNSMKHTILLCPIHEPSRKKINQVNGFESFCVSTCIVLSAFHVKNINEAREKIDDVQFKFSVSLDQAVHAFTMEEADKEDKHEIQDHSAFALQCPGLFRVREVGTW